jgi:hypothetical protein
MDLPYGGNLSTRKKRKVFVGFPDIIFDGHLKQTLALLISSGHYTVHNYT